MFSLAVSVDQGDGKTGPLLVIYCNRPLVSKASGKASQSSSAHYREHGRVVLSTGSMAGWDCPQGAWQGGTVHREHGRVVLSTGSMAGWYCPQGAWQDGIVHKDNGRVVLSIRTMAGCYSVLKEMTP